MEYVSREKWGAPAVSSWQPLITPVQVVWLHTGAVRLHNIGDPAEEVRHVRSYEDTARKRGWRAVGYNWLVGQSGRIYEGRGWHKSGANYGASNLAAVSICVIGHGDYEQLGDSARDAILSILTVVNRQFGWAGTNLKGHREEDGVTKSCPGKYPFDFVLDYRNGEYPLGGSAPVTNPGDGKVVYVHGLNQAPWLKLAKPYMNGQGVRSCQLILGSLGYDTGKVDGVYGPHTLSAVREFQRFHDLQVDGIVGKDTWFALFGEPDKNLHTVTPMMRGHDVGAVQAVVSTRVDNVYGPVTQGAVTRFQRSKRIKADGIVGPTTRGVMAGVKP